MPARVCPIRQSCLLPQPSRFCLTFLLSLVLVLALDGSFGRHSAEWGGRSPALAQIFRPEQVAQQVYEQLPDLPRENDYIRIETGEVATDHTLVSRLIRYHRYVKDRPTLYRIDWLLTFSDYLGANDPVKQERYPGYQSLSVNPCKADLAAFSQLNRQQRSELADLLVSLFQPPKPPPQKVPQSDDHPSSTPTLAPPQRQRSLSEPGDADLLKF